MKSIPTHLTAIFFVSVFCSLSSALAADTTPPGILSIDSDAQNFVPNKRDPLRGFEEHASGWMREHWQTLRGLGEPKGIPAERTDSNASEGKYSLKLPVGFPNSTVLFKKSSIGKFKYITYDVFIPKDVPGRATAIFFLKTKDGLWFQANSGVPLLKNEEGYTRSNLGERLRVGRWNTVTVDLRAESTNLEPINHTTRWHNRFAPLINYLGFAFNCTDPFKGEVLFDNLRGWHLKSNTRPLAISNLRYKRTAKTNERFEITFNLNQTFRNPFDPALIAVDAVITNPEGKKFDVAGFFAQDFNRAKKELLEELTPKGRGNWRIRYAPRIVGEHKFTITVKSENGTITTRSRSFVAEAGSPNKGYVQISGKDPRAFELDSGEPFFIIGHNLRSPIDGRGSHCLGWDTPRDQGTYNYDPMLENMAAGGENLLELWMSSWWLALEWTKDWKGFKGLGNYNLKSAWRMDYILNRARELNLRIHLVIDNHGKYSTWCDEEWDYSPYNLKNKSSGGFLRRPEEFFRNTHARKLYKRKLRYIIARWGYDSTIAGIELISELDLTGSRGGFGRPRISVRDGKPVYATVHTWHMEMFDYIHKIDHSRHLLTTHYAGDHKNVDENMVKLPQMDYIVADGYRGDARPFADLAFASGEHLSKFGKPYVVTEYGGNWSGASDAALRADLHSGLWSSFMSPSAGTALLWWFDFIEKKDLYFHYSALNNFAKGEDRRDPNLISKEIIVKLKKAQPTQNKENKQPDDPTAEKPKEAKQNKKPAQKTVAALGYLAPTYGWAWAYSIEAMTREPDEKVLLQNATLELTELQDGEWMTEFWDTYRGIKTGESTFDVKGGKCSLPLPDFRNDIALKLKLIKASKPSPAAPTETQDQAEDTTRK